MKFDLGNADEFPAKQFFRFGFIGIALWAAFWIAILVVAWHFISKLW